VLDPVSQRPLVVLHGPPFLVMCGMGVAQQALGRALLPLRAVLQDGRRGPCVVVECVIMRAGGQRDAMLGDATLAALGLHPSDLWLGGGAEECCDEDPLAAFRRACLGAHQASGPEPADAFYQYPQVSHAHNSRHARSEGSGVFASHPRPSFVLH
jgi:hypothetical protein